MQLSATGTHVLRHILSSAQYTLRRSNCHPLPACPTRCPQSSMLLRSFTSVARWVSTCVACIGPLLPRPGAACPRFARPSFLRQPPVGRFPLLRVFQPPDLRLLLVRADAQLPAATWIAREKVFKAPHSPAPADRAAHACRLNPQVCASRASIMVRWYSFATRTFPSSLRTTGFPAVSPATPYHKAVTSAYFGRVAGRSAPAAEVDPAADAASCGGSTEDMARGARAIVKYLRGSLVNGPPLPITCHGCKRAEAYA